MDWTTHARWLVHSPPDPVIRSPFCRLLVVLSRGEQKAHDGQHTSFGFFGQTRHTKSIHVTAGPQEMVGRCIADGKQDGKTKYINETTGAVMCFDAAASRWKLGVAQASSDEPFKWVYASSANVDRSVPWDKKHKLRGKHWKSTTSTPDALVGKGGARAALEFTVVNPSKETLLAQYKDSVNRKLWAMDTVLMAELAVTDGVHKFLKNYREHREAVRSSHGEERPAVAVLHDTVGQSPFALYLPLYPWPICRQVCQGFCHFVCYMGA